MQFTKDFDFTVIHRSKTRLHAVYNYFISSGNRLHANCKLSYMGKVNIKSILIDLTCVFTHFCSWFIKESEDQ